MSFPPWLIVIFLVMFAVVVVAVSVGLRYVEIQQKKKVAGVVAIVNQQHEAVRSANVLRDASIDDPWDRPAVVFSKLNFYQKVEEAISQAALSWHPAAVISAMLVLGMAGALIGLKLRVLVFSWASSLGLGLALGFFPWFYLNLKRNARMREFEQQFPEALDFLARSMRAGHAFSVSLEMLAQESAEPLKTEIGKVFHEHNLGAPMEVALKNLSVRIPLLDVRFFVSSVMLQRDTGGNLGEILTKLAYVIRERFRLKGQVRAASAHGRMTATILILLPIALTFGLTIVAPGYLQSMADDETGQWMILGAIVGQFLGFYFIRRIINIKV